MSFFSRTALRHKTKTFFHFAGFAFADQVMVSGINFMVAIALARLLGVTAFGQFSLVLILVFFCLELQRALITAPMMHWVAKGADKGYFHRLMQMQLLLAVLLSVGGGLFIWASGFWFQKWQIQSLALGSGFLIFFRLIQEFMRRFLFVMDKKNEAMLMDGIIGCAIVLWLFALYYVGALHIETVIIAHMFAYAGSIVFLLRVVRDQEMDIPGSAKKFIAQHWDFGGWLLAAVIVTYASSNLLVMTGGAILGPEAAGLVKAAQYMMGGMIVLFQAIENIVPFHMAKLAHQGKNAALYLFALKSTLGMLGFCLLHGLAVLYFVDPLSYWLAPGFGKEIKPLVIGSVMLSILMVLGYNLQYLLRAKGKTKPIFFANAVTAVISLVAGKPLVENFGAMGIVVGLIVVNVTAQLVYAGALFFGRKKVLA